MSKKIIVKAIIVMGLLGLGHVSGKLTHIDLLSNESYRLDSRLTSTGNVCIMLLPNTLKPEKPIVSLARRLP